MLDRRMQKKGNKAVVYVLIQWENGSVADATWEQNYITLPQIPSTTDSGGGWVGADGGSSLIGSDDGVALQGRDKLPESLSDEEKDELMEKTHGAIILNLADNEDRVLILLCSLPKSYEHLVITLLYGRETISMEDVKSALNSSELRKKVSADYVEESANGLMVRGRRNDKASSNRGQGDSDGANVLSVIDDRSGDEWILD
ncbi:hypothetical protein Tco_0111004 [Tanacetum coccineum]